MESLPPPPDSSGTDHPALGRGPDGPRRVRGPAAHARQAHAHPRPLYRRALALSDGLTALRDSRSSPTSARAPNCGGRHAHVRRGDHNRQAHRTVREYVTLPRVLGRRSSKRPEPSRAGRRSTIAPVSRDASYARAPFRTALGASRRAAALVWRGEDPPRYDEDFLGPFREAFTPVVRRPGARILDLGSGRCPTIPPQERSEGTFYVGLDMSADELRLASPRSYDEHVVADASRELPELRARFDLVVSLYVLEHIADLRRALQYIRSYLAPGGQLVALFSGRYSAFGLVNRLLPDRISSPFVARHMNRERSSVFPAYYDQCHFDALGSLLAGWSSFDVETSWRGLNYFRFSRTLSTAYIAYEEFAKRRGLAILAPYYLIRATR